MPAITFANARRNFDALFDKVLSERTPVTILRHRGEAAVIIAEEEWTTMISKLDPPVAGH